MLVALVPAGSTLREDLGLPDLYAAIGTLVPGFDAIRVVSRLGQGVFVAGAILAGIGAASLIRRSGRYGALTATVIALAAFLDVVRAPILGFERSYRWTYESVRPSDEDIAFFAELERLGNRGAILEMPVYNLGPRAGAYPKIHGTESSRILLAAYHRRRTSACFGSYLPPGRRELAKLAGRLPDPEAIEALRALGFTTVVLDARKDPAAARRLGGAPAPSFAPIHHTSSLSAYALEAPDRAPHPAP